MKFLLNFFLLTLLFASCGSPTSKNEKAQNGNPEIEDIQTTSSKDDDRVSGSFELIVDGTKFNSISLQDNYCDMTFNYAGEKSFVVIRFRDEQTRDAVLLTLYGTEDFVDSPIGKIENFMGQGRPYAMVQFIPGEREGAIQITSMAEGILNIAEFDKGAVTANFSGLGGSPIDVAKKENLISLEGKVNLKTKNITVVGKEK